MIRFWFIQEGFHNCFHNIICFRLCGKTCPFLLLVLVFESHDDYLDEQFVIIDWKFGIVREKIENFYEFDPLDPIKKIRSFFCKSRVCLATGIELLILRKKQIKTSKTNMLELNQTHHLMISL